MDSMRSCMRRLESCSSWQLAAVIASYLINCHCRAQSCHWSTPVKDEALVSFLTSLSAGQSV
eukprot:1189097-Amphidinium_carterae.1